MTSNTPLQTGGINSVNIGKGNLTNVKLKVDTVIANTYYFTIVEEQQHLQQ